MMHSKVMCNVCHVHVIIDQCVARGANAPFTQTKFQTIHHGSRHAHQAQTCTSHAGFSCQPLRFELLSSNAKQPVFMLGSVRLQVARVQQRHSRVWEQEQPSCRAWLQPAWQTLSSAECG